MSGLAGVGGRVRINGHPAQPARHPAGQARHPTGASAVPGRPGDAAHGTIDHVVLAVEIVLIATVVFVVAALAVGRFDRLAPAAPDGPHVGLGGQTVASGDVEAVRFGMAARGYRMAEVDAVLSRLAYELAWRDEELARRDDELLRLAELARLGGVRDPATDPGDDTADQLYADSAPTDSAPTDSGTSADRGATGRPADEPDPAGPAGEPGPIEPSPTEPGPAGGRGPVSGLGTSTDLGVARGDARHDGPDRGEPRGPRPVQDQPGEPGTVSLDKDADGQQ